MWLLLSACRPPPTDVVETPHTAPSGDTASPPISEPPLVFRGHRPKHVLMLSIDTTRRDHFGDLGDTVYMPFFAERMGEAVVLEDHQQCSDWTYASTSCTLIGRMPEDNGFAPTLRGDTLPLPDGQVTLASRLGDHGFYSLLLSPNSWLGDKWNNAQGYDESAPPGTGRAMEIVQVGIDHLQAAIAQGHDRWLLHLHFLEPHAPYVPPEEYYADELSGVPPLPKGWDLSTEDGHYAVVNRWPSMSPDEQALLETHLRARYHGELRFLDTQLAGMWPALDDAGLLDDTLVVVWTDHGEQFYERGHESHAWNLNAEENDAVLFFWAKNLEPARWKEPTHAIDLVPTVLDALGFPDDDPTLPGFVLGQAPRDRARFGMSVARAGTLQSVTREDRKLVFDWDTGLRAWDRKRDRFEATDVLTLGPEDQALWELLEPRVEALHALVPNERLVWPEGVPHP